MKWIGKTLPAQLEAEISEMHSILQELDNYRLQAIDIKLPGQ